MPLRLGEKIPGIRYDPPQGTAVALPPLSNTTKRFRQTMLLRQFTIILALLPAVCGAQHSRRAAADTAFTVADYSLDRDYSEPSESAAAKPDDDGKSVRRFSADDAGVVEAVQLLMAAAPGQFKSVRIEGSKQVDDILGGADYDGRVAINGGLLTATKPGVHEEGGSGFSYNLPVLAGATKELAARRTQALLKILPPLVGKDADTEKTQDFAGVLHYTITADASDPALRIEQVGGDVTIVVYPSAYQIMAQ